MRILYLISLSGESEYAWRQLAERWPDAHRIIDGRTAIVAAEQGTAPENRELIEHRLGQLEANSKQTIASLDRLKDSIGDLSNQVTGIRTGMATKKELWTTVITILIAVCVAALSVFAHWGVRKLFE